MIHLVGPVLSQPEGGYAFESFNATEGRTRSSVYRDYSRARYDRSATVTGLAEMKSLRFKIFATSLEFEAAVAEQIKETAQ